MSSVRTRCVVHSLAGILLAAPAIPAPGDPPSRELLLELTQQTRLAGTVGSLVAAKNVARRLEEAGWKTEIEEREVLLSYPRHVELAIYAGDSKTSVTPLSERIERFDPDAIPPGDVPLYNAWSASGEVRAKVVDAGRGLRADFERLKKSGVELKGTIALARYGGSYRGIKVDLATQYGCAGILLFSESSSDGAAKGATWPQGPWKPPYEAQRGSISPMGRTPGDPSTPGWASPKKGETAKRLSGKELEDALPKIPCLPIGAEEAERILAGLTKQPVLDKDGNIAEAPIGPGPIEVRMLVDSPRELRPLRNVIATLAGASEDCVIAGAHRDAWVRGANDDGSGTVCMIRAAQRLGERAKSGWKPKNSIVIGLWDAEEFGMLGSTEWAEGHAEWITKHCFAYVNSDTGCQGTHFSGASGTPGLLRVLKAALERVPTPEPRKDAAPKNLWEDWLAQLNTSASRHPERLPNAEPEISPAGSGSDFAVFLHHLSKPVVDISLGGNSGGQYHTTFDDFAIVDRYLDPGFVGHEMCGQLLAELLGEMADEGPSCFDNVEAARALAALSRKAGDDKDEGRAWLGPGHAERIARRFDQLAETCAIDCPDSFHLYEVLRLEKGIPGREWYRNPVWTPGLEDGYGSELFPVLHAAGRRGDEALTVAVDAMLLSLENARSSIPVPARRTGGGR
jgi:N-acetylated-alpha-linked acidic dipeptidase